ncbi:protein TALPID3 [Stegastes partitus]|uniref:Protein TALPID3 n=1 Tax=Stegastes partitus TaxID=144197 RepID=A0A9Y4MX53_9TELE|nr:PREDICTED: protein TALPID3 [Stegastes partitus]
MLSQRGSGSFSGPGSPDQSACGSDTGSVLIRSTRPLPRGHGAGPGSVQITIQKLREPPRVQPPLSGQQRQKLRHRPDTGAPPPPAAADPEPGHDLLTSRFTAGGRGIVLAALKQRAHSAPHRREVRVQLLPLQTNTTSSQDAAAPSSQDAAGVSGIHEGVELPSGRLGDASSAAASAASAAVAAAAAPLIKAQSDMEARVSQLADGVQKLLQADRDGEGRGRSLNQQTLLQLETLQNQQLQLQSQLLESALRIVTGHAPPASDLTASGRPAHLQVTHLDAAANGRSSSATAASSAATAAVETVPVAMETCRRDRWPEQTRDERYLQHAPSVSTADRILLQSSANHSQEAARKANEVLREMGRLKAEMKMLLTQPEDSLKTLTPAPDHHQIQQNQHLTQLHQSQQNQSHQNQSQTKKLQQNQSQLSQSLQNRSKQNQSQQQSKQSLSQSQQNQSQSHLNQSQQSKSKENQSQSQLSQCHQNLSHQNQSQQTSSQDNPFTYKPSHFQLNQSQAQKSQSQQKQSEQNQSHNSQGNHVLYEPPEFRQSHQHMYRQNQSQSHPLFHQIQPQQHQTHQTQSQQFQSVLVQRKPVVPSTLEEAGQVLRQVRRQKKVMEENLEALLRAKTGEVLHCQLEALAANRDWTEEVRIKKTVDAWINTLTRDIQAEMSSEDAARCRAADAAVTSQSSAHPGRTKPLSVPRTAASRPAAGRGSRGRTSGHRTQQQGAEPDATPGRLTDSEQVDGESYLNRLYGRAPYEGLRRTLKKSPYLRLNSPASPLGKKPRPRLVESVRGVKLKSCKTQTSLAPPLNMAPPLNLSPVRHHHVFSSSHLTSGDPADLPVTPADSQPVAVAIPLGRPRIDSSRRPPTVTSPPAPPPKAAVVTADDGSPEQQQKQQLDADEAPPPPLPPSHTINIIERKSDEEEEEEEEEEENVFPGTDFLSVADVVQEPSVEAEEEVLLDGGPSPPPVLYQGPAFPPQARSALPAQDQVSVPGIEQQRDALETRLVEWVEQQLMSRIIADMYRPLPPDPAHNQHTDQSELEERSVTSDIVEAAGGGGLQLFVDSNTPVDSELIRQLVNEVLTETVALMLGQRDTLDTGPEPEPGPAAPQQDKLVPLVPTPVPTPPPSPTKPSRDTALVTTPPPSEPTSPLSEEPPQPITTPEPVATPTPSPEPAPSAGSPPAVEAPPSLTWGDAELPLDEERPEEHLDTHKQQLYERTHVFTETSTYYQTLRLSPPAG